MNKGKDIGLIDLEAEFSIVHEGKEVEVMFLNEFCKKNELEIHNVKKSEHTILKLKKKTKTTAMTRLVVLDKDLKFDSNEVKSLVIADSGKHHKVQLLSQFTKKSNYSRESLRKFVLAGVIPAIRLPYGKKKATYIIKKTTNAK